jgi:hypothetical protein
MGIQLMASALIPNCLDGRISPTGHSVHRVVFTGNLYDYSASSFAAQIAFGPLGRLTKINCPYHCGDHDQRSGHDEQPHGHKPRADFLSNSLKFDTFGSVSGNAEGQAA